MLFRELIDISKHIRTMCAKKQLVNDWRALLLFISYKIIHMFVCQYFTSIIKVLSV
jgi:hypothetical protein